MIKLDSMEWDHFHTIKQKVLRELINELSSLEIPPDWRPEETLGFIIRILEDKERSC
jgi:hypothetical protein